MAKIGRFLLSLMIAFVSVSANAQIPKDVTTIIKKCQTTMENPKGVQTDMEIRVGVAVFSMKGNGRSYSKGEKSLTRIKFKVLGQEMNMESGSDGVQDWVYRSMPAEKKATADTLTISPHKKESSKGEYDVDFDLDKEYKKASMKVKGNEYVITFTEPKDKKMPKKAVMHINKKNYHIHEFEAKQNGMSMRINFTNVKFGLSDDLFKLDLKKYPNAVIIRK